LLNVGQKISGLLIPSKSCLQLTLSIFQYCPNFIFAVFSDYGIPRKCGMGLSYIKFESLTRIIDEMSGLMGLIYIEYISKKVGYKSTPRWMA